MQKGLKNRTKEIVKYTISLFEISIFPVTFLYCANIKEMKFGEAVPALLAYILLGGLVWIIFQMIFKCFALSLAFTFVGIIIISNFCLLEKVVSKISTQIRYWHLVIVLIVIIGHLAFFASKIISKEIEIYVVNTLFVLITALTFINIIPALFESKFWQDDIRLSNSSLPPAEIQSDDDRNIYYFLLDEYSSLSVINKYYNFDNKEFEKYLLNNEFEIVYNGINESNSTHTVVTNYMNLAYVATNDMSIPARQNLRYNSRLYEVLQDANYKIIGCGESTFLGIDSYQQKATNNAGATIDGLNFTQMVFKQSIFYPFINDKADERINLIRDTFSFFQNEKNYPLYKDGKYAVFTYLETPHQPFYFKEDGTLNSYSNYNNWDDKQYYLGQYKYVTNEITKCINTIINSDPKAIIIIQSDHSARTYIPEEDTVKPFQAVRYIGHSYESLDTLSGVNVLRRVIGELTGNNFSQVEVP